MAKALEVVPAHTQPDRIRPADAVPAAALHEAFVAAFADYIAGPFRIAAEDWPSLLARQAIDLGPSRVVVDDEGKVAAFALVAPRDARHWRLATMAARPEARGSGAAPALLDELIERAGSCGLQTLELEVFAQNERAFRLYSGRGFAVLHELHGYRVEAAVAPAGEVPRVEEIDLDAAMQWLRDATQALPFLPLQVTPACLPHLKPPLRAWRHGGAQIVYSADEPGLPVRIHSLVDRDPAQPGAATLLRALCVRHAGAAIVVPPLQRLDVGGQALRDLGFPPLTLHQCLMVKRLG